MQQPVETIDGWYCFHLFWKVNWPGFRAQKKEVQQQQFGEFKKFLQEFDQNEQAEQGSWYLFDVSGHKADLGLILFRETLAQLNEIEDRLAKLPLFAFLTETDSFVSVGEAGTYSGKPRSERGWSYVNKHIKPKLPKKPYVSFYPMSKLRIPGANWYELPYEERQKHMKQHGLIGRRYAGKIWQYITGAIGFDDYEWGVTLFADDPIVFKKIISEMRYAQASSLYGEFPYFLVGTYLDQPKLEHLFLDDWKKSFK